MHLKSKLNLSVFALSVFIISSAEIKAQDKLSFDAAVIRNLPKEINGLNLSCFYHFTEHLSGGLEMNRFFAANKTIEGEDVQLSAWDFDLNFHYILPLYKNWKWYPVCGVSHTSEKEKIAGTDESSYERFFSVNAGAGTLLECGHWVPHIEYTYTWGKLNQQFLLAGISYELELGHHKKDHHIN
jgi:hypothetical protein